MKELYKTPAIKVEELAKSDALCESGIIKNGKYNVEGSAMNWQVEDTL